VEDAITQIEAKRAAEAKASRSEEHV